MPMPLLIPLYFLLPVLIIWLSRTYTLANRIGVVIMAYLVGITLGNVGLLGPEHAGLQDTLSGVSVALALPLLLFSMNVRAWLSSAGKAILSMLGATALVSFMAGIGVFLVRDGIPKAWQFGGMAIGLYTGGTPNLAAIKTALSVDPTWYIMMHTYDAVNGIIYLIFVMSIGQKVFSFLGPYRFSGNRSEETSHPDDGYRALLRKEQLAGNAKAIGLSVLILGMSFGFASLVPASANTAVIMLSITSLGIAASFVKPIREIPHTFPFGMYLILVFSVVVGSMADLSELININWHMMFLVNFIVFGTMLMHALFCKLVGVDRDTFLITSVAAVCSPPFVPVVAKALNNKEIILSGLTTGIIGYAVGNYLGVGFAYLFKSFLF